MNPFPSDHRWVERRYYQETPSATNSVSGTSTSADGTTSSIDPNNTTTSPPKPIRRRSRASRRTPTTLLTTSPTDFRALVQQFTGYQGPDEAAVAKSRVPRNINFATNYSDTTSTTPLRYNVAANNTSSSSSYNRQLHPPPLVGQHQHVTPHDEASYYPVQDSSSVVDQAIHEFPTSIGTYPNGTPGYFF